MIADKRITLNGVAVETPATLLKSLHGVAVDGKAVGQPAPTMLYLFHKPEGCLTAERDFSGRKTIYDILPKDLPRLMPIGRLDLNTEGLLLLTNDGEFKRQMEMALDWRRAHLSRALFWRHQPSSTRRTDPRH